MTKASLTLPNGTVVQIEGSPEEVKHLLELYGATGLPAKPAVGPKAKKPRRASAHQPSPDATKGGAAPDLAAIVNLVKTCDEAEDIEQQILDRSSQVDRTLLPLYIVHEHLQNAFGLSSGDVSKVTTDLGVPVSQPAASRTLSSTAAKYVIGDRVRKKGQLVRYKLSRRGAQYLQTVIRGAANEDAS